MVMKNILLLSLILGLFVTYGINAYYSDTAMSDIGQAALNVPNVENSVLASAAGNIIVYLIVMSALYLFLRSVVKTFGA